MNPKTDQLGRPRAVAPRPTPRRTFAFVSFSLLFAAALAAGTWAQSGRRAPKPQEIAPVPTPTPVPTPKRHETDVTNKINVLVVGEESYAMQASTVEGLVRESFMQRLRESGSLVIDTDSSRTTKGGAQKRAKDEKERFVVWMTLRYAGGAVDPINMQRARAQDYYIEYGVFEPATGKTHSSGNVYLRAGYGTIGGVAVGAPTCYPSTYANELEFVYGAIDTANRVMRSLDVPPPPLCGK